MIPFFVAMIYFFKNKDSFIYGAMFTQNKKRKTPKPGSISYELNNGLKCAQMELNLKQDDELMKLLKDFNFDDVKEGNVRIKTVLDFLINNNALIIFLRIILSLDETVTDETILKINNSEMLAVINDFFLLNPGTMQLFRHLQQTAVITNMMNLKNTQEQKNSENDSTEQKK